MIGIGLTLAMIGILTVSFIKGVPPTQFDILFAWFLVLFAQIRIYFLEKKK